MNNVWGYAFCFLVGYIMGAINDYYRNKEGK